MPGSGNRNEGRPVRVGQLATLAITSLCVLCLVGCQSTHWIRMRRMPDTPLAEPLKLFSWTGPEPTPRTMQWLRRFDLVDALDLPPQSMMAQITAVTSQQRTPDNAYVLAELGFLAGKRAEAKKDSASAFDMYGIAVANAYLYLVDEEFDLARNPFDPRFRQACDLYNASLEGAMRLAQKNGPLVPGSHRSIRTAKLTIELTVESLGTWKPEQIERIEFASDYKVNGLTNHYRNYGLGVPLIAVYRRDGQRSEDHYYAPGMSVPATAFLRVQKDRLSIQNGESIHYCTLELHDPLVTSDTLIEGRRIPLETDLSTPLAYSLSDKMFQQTDIGTRGLINPHETQSVQGIYLLEPYDPRKVPVLMVHGLWSSLITWMEMFNDLRGDREIRDNYQFWFYLYPTGQPFWLTATQLRQDLEKARSELDPDRRAIALDKMVLVGHSMGGLVSKLQTLNSSDDYWRLVSPRPLADLQAPDDLKVRLQQMLYFHANPSIQRVVTIATPHRGSEFSNGTTQWLARKLIRLPEQFVENSQRLFADNADLRHSPLLNIKNSIDSLSPQSPILPVMLASPKPPWVAYHNIVGILPEDEVIGRVAPRGDGIVKFESAHLEDVASEAIVPEDHVMIHRHPRTVLEVQRILLEHLAVLRASISQ